MNGKLYKEYKYIIYIQYYTVMNARKVKIQIQKT